MIYLGCQRVEQVGQSTFPATATMEAIGSYSQTGAEAAAQPKTLSSEMDGSNRGLLTVPRSQVHQLAASDRPQIEQIDGSYNERGLQIYHVLD